MNDAPRETSASAPLKPRAYMVLLLLAERPRHGYDLLAALERRSDGAMKMNAGSFYRLIHGLAEEGLVQRVQAPEDEPSGGGERKTYGLTPDGLARLRAEIARQESLLELGRQWLG
ncbi:MAG: PadR family transcriptional regulator [Acidobacteriota bacterium]|jgi:DNA-binding PadR family transcriptional regulator